MNKEINLHQSEDNLFKKWKKMQEIPEEEFVYDGLHYLGNFYYKNGCWGRKPGEEEKLWETWCKQRRGLVILTKDLNDKESWDIREEHGRKNNDKCPTPSKCTFYRHLVSWVYGLQNIDMCGNMPNFPEREVSQNHFERSPWVRMNLKKKLGISRVSNKDLLENIMRDKELLLDQLKLYEKATIYLDCTTRNGIKLLNDLHHDLQPFIYNNEDWIYYSESTLKFAVNSYHPSYPQNNILYYQRMKNAVMNFFHCNPVFLPK